MKFTDTQVTVDHISKIPVEAAGGLKGFTTPNAIAIAIDDGTLTIAQTSGLQSALDTLQDNIDAIPPTVAAVASDVVTLDGRIDGHDADIVTLDSRLDGHDADVVTLDGRIDGHDADIAGIGVTLLTKANKTGGNTFTGHQLFDTTEQNFTDFIPKASPPAYKEGRVFYDNVDKTLSYYVDVDSGVMMNIGREMWVRVKNITAEAIANGAVVYIKDAADEYATVELALADDIDTSRVIGVVTHSIESNAFGYITCAGVVKGLNLAAYSDGQVLYLSPTVPGTLQTTPPAAPNVIVRVGIVEYAHPSNGKLFVHPETQSIPSIGILDGTHLATPLKAVIRSATGGANFVDIGIAGNIIVNKTITPAGTTSTQTIHKNFGSVNFARHAESVTVINNLVVPSSIILTTKATDVNDCRLGGVVAGNGQFVINMDTRPGAECRVNFVVFN